MRRLIPVLLAAAAVVVLGVLVWRALAPRPEDANVLSGYVEGEALYLASPSPGAVTRLSVVRGQRVSAGAPLFAVDPRSPDAQRREAGALLDQARAQLVASQAAAAQQAASYSSARSTADNAQRDALRYQALLRTGSGAVSTQEADKAKTTALTAQAQAVAAADAERNAEAQVAVARANVAHAEAGLSDADARLSQFAVNAPASGQVEETFFQVGEWAGANQPVVSLIPDGKVKLKFYVPEADLALYKVGRVVRYGCDGCGPGRTAVIDYVSPRPEYTPPVIYARKARDRMVFLIEARPTGAGLSPGQPVDITPLAARRQ